MSQPTEFSLEEPSLGGNDLSGLLKAFSFVGLNAEHIPSQGPGSVEGLKIFFAASQAAPAFVMQIAFLSDLLPASRSARGPELAWKLQYTVELPLELQPGNEAELAECVMYLNQLSALGDFRLLGGRLYFSHLLLSESRRVPPPLGVRCARLMARYLAKTLPALMAVNSGKLKAKAALERLRPVPRRPGA